MAEEVGVEEEEEEGRVPCLPREPLLVLPPALPPRVGGDGEGERVGVTTLSSPPRSLPPPLPLLERLSPPDPEEEPPAELG